MKKIDVLKALSLMIFFVSDASRVASSHASWIPWKIPRIHAPNVERILEPSKLNFLLGNAGAMFTAEKAKKVTKILCFCTAFTAIKTDFLLGNDFFEIKSKWDIFNDFQTLSFTWERKKSLSRENVERCLISWRCSKLEA